MGLKGRGLVLCWHDEAVVDRQRYDPPPQQPKLDPLGHIGVDALEPSACTAVKMLLDRCVLELYLANQTRCINMV